MIANILGVQKNAEKEVALLNEQLSSRPNLKKQTPTGLARELAQLCGNSLPSLLINQQSTEASLSSKQPVVKWIKASFTNSSHPCASIHLHQWYPVDKVENSQSADTSTSDTPRACCYYKQKGDFSGAAFNKKPDLVKYTHSLYQKLLANLSKHWTLWETDYLFYLCSQFDLHFVVIYDRYEPLKEITLHMQRRRGFIKEFGKNAHTVLYEATLTAMPLQAIEELYNHVSAGNPRTICELKDRYYSIAKKVLKYEHSKKMESIEAEFALITSTPENTHLIAQQKSQVLAETRAEFARHPLIKFHYDPDADEQRRQHYDEQYRQGSIKSIKEKEKELVSEVLEMDSNIKNPLKKKDGGKEEKMKTLYDMPPEFFDSDTDLFIPMSAVHSSMIQARKPGPILASQVMQQFGASMLLQPLSHNPSTYMDKQSSSQTRKDSDDTNAFEKQRQQQGHLLPVLSKKHEAKIQAELEALSFDNTHNSIWPTYCDREMIEAFNALRFDIATMINYQTKVDLLIEEKALCTAKVGQLTEESLIHHEAASRPLGGLGDGENHRASTDASETNFQHSIAFSDSGDKKSRSSKKRGF